jgi:hypothetical protein
LYDAVYLSAHDEPAHEVGRKAMILLTDGEDQGSQLRIRDAIEAAQKSDSICYVLIADRGFGGFGYSGDSEMKACRRDRWPRYRSRQQAEKLKEADQIAKELRSQYNVGYTPPTTSGRLIPQNRSPLQARLQNSNPKATML